MDYCRAKMNKNRRLYSFNFTKNVKLATKVQSLSFAKACFGAKFNVNTLSKTASHTFFYLIIRLFF